MFNFVKNRIIYIIVSLSFFSFALLVNAQSVNIDASQLLSHSEITFSPRSGSFEEGSTFQVPILVNTKNKSINGIEVRVNFDKDKLLVVNPISGNSIIGVWVETPKYNNTEGTASYVGVVPGGITTEAGLVGVITFKAKAPGRAVVSFDNRSKVLLNDGLGTETVLNFTRAEYSIFPKAPEGVQIFSETHPIQTTWYNNNSPVFSWVKDPKIEGFSFVFDNKPNTIPENTIMTPDTTQAFNNIQDGLWYFHVKAVQNGAWGTTGHFLVRIDTTPPARFKPNVDFLVAPTMEGERTLVSFLTTDNLSGIDYYEVGVIDKSQALTESPVFVQTGSPFQIPTENNGQLQVIVRAVDGAGNTRDESIEVKKASPFSKFLGDYAVYILSFIILVGLGMLITHYLFGHHVLHLLNRLRQILNRQEKEQREYLQNSENTIDQEMKEILADKSVSKTEENKDITPK